MESIIVVDNCFTTHFYKYYLLIRVDDFEFTSKQVIFDLLNLELNHGWLPDPTVTPDLFQSMRKLSYNQLVDFSIETLPSNELAG